MGGSILDQAYDDKRNAALDDELDALVSDYDRRNPPVEPKPTAPTEQTQPEEDADLWTEGPDRPQRISKKAGSSQTASFWGGLKAADDSFRQRQAAGTVTPDTNPNVAFARGLQGTGSDVGKTIEALGPGWQKLWHDAQAFIAENPNGLPRDWQLMSDDQEAYFAEFGGPGFGEGPAGLPGPDMVAPFRSPEEAVAANKAVRKAQLKAAVKEAELRAKLPTSDDPLRQGVIDATFNIGMMVPSLVAGFATRNPYLAVSMMSTQTGVGSYGDARRAGAEPGKAYRYGVTMGAIEGLTEIIPTKLLIGDFVKRTDFIEAFTKQMVADGLGEQAATHLQDLTTWIELNPDKTLDEFLAERPAATIRTAISSAMVSTALTGTTSAINAVTAPKKEGEAAPTPETPPEAAPASPETPAEQSAEAAPAPDGEQAAPTPEQADLLDTVNKVADAVDMAQAEQVPPITPQQESEDQKFVRGVEQALGIKRPAAPVETPEERRSRAAERRAAEQRQTEESTARVVEGVRTFAEARNAAEQAVERAVETPAPATIVEAVAAHNELAEQTEAEPISLAEEMGVDTTDRTSSLAEAERMASELEAMGTEEAAIAAMQFRTLVQYSDRYDDNTFWQGFDEAIENAAPFLMSEEQQQAIVEKVAEAVEDAPLAPEEEASATIVEEVRATAPASRYFGRKSFGGEGLATETPATTAPVEQQAPAQPAPQRVAPKGPAISESQLAAITAKEQKTARKVVAREAMALKAESVYDDVLSKDVLEYLDDQFDMTERQVREVMGKAIDGQGSLDRFNTLMRRYAKVRAELDREAASAGEQVQADFEALAAAQPDPGEGGLGRSMQSLLDEQGVNPETKFSTPKSKRKPVKDPEKNRKRLDARAYSDWGQNYLDLVQKGQLSYASAEELESMGIPGSVNAVTINDPMTGTGETIINTSLVRPEHIEGILLHEVGIHRGLRSLMGNARFEGVLASLDRLVDSFDKKQAAGEKTTRAERSAKAARMHAIKNATKPEQVREETLAYMVEQHVTNPFLPPFLTELKVAIGRRFPGIIDRLGWGAPEYAQLALVSLRRFILKEIKHLPNDQALPGNRSPRAPFLLQVTYPDGFRKLANKQGAALSPQSWARRAMTMGQMQMWRMIRTLDLRNVETFPQQLKDMERDLTSPEVFDAFFQMDENFDWENYLDLMYLAQQGDPDAAYDLTEILTRLKGMDVPVDIQFSMDGQAVLELTPDMQVKNFPPMILTRAQRIGGVILPDPQTGFITSAEKAINIPPARFENAKSLTYDQWLKYFEVAGVSKEAMEIQVFPALQELTARPDQSDYDMKSEISKADMIEALIANRPKVKFAQEKDYSTYVAAGIRAGYEQEVIVLPELAKGFQSHNWDTDGVVAHIRYTQRLDADGNTVLHTEELQSDLHQEGAKHGYKNEGVAEKRAALEQQRAEMRPQVKAILRANDNLGYDSTSEALYEMLEASPSSWEINSPDELAVLTKFYDVVHDIRDLDADALGAPPDAPMKDWEAPLVRRAISKAFDMGLEVVTFPTFATLHKALRNEGTRKFYDERLPATIRRVANEFGLKVEMMDIQLADSAALDEATSEVLALESALLNSPVDEAQDFYEGRLAEARAARDRILSQSAQSVPGIRVSQLAGHKLALGNVMFSRDIEDTSSQPEADPALEEVYFNFMRFGDPDTVHPTIREALKSAAVADRMGPPMTLRETEIDARNTNAFEAMVKSRKGETLTFAELTALRNMHKYSALKLKELADMANADPSDKSLEAAVMRASMFHTALLAEIKGQSAQAARTLNAMKIQAKATAAIATAVDNMLGEANTTGDLRRMIRDLAQMDASKIANLNKRVEMSTWKAWQDLAGTWLRAMYLSMPSTHIVNALGNITTMLGSIADHHVAGRITFDPDLVEESRVRFDAMIEAFVHQFTYMKANSQLNPLKPNTSIKFDADEVSGVNRWEGQDRALSAARMEKLTGGLVKAHSGGTLWENPVGVLAEVIGYGLAAPSEALGTADDLFKGANFRISMRGQAFRQAREERRAGKITEAQEAARAQEIFDNPPDAMVKQAIFEAQENTFTRPVGPMTKTAMSVRQWLNSGTGALGYLLMPFILTPSNIMSFRFRRMPTAPLFQEWRDSFNKGGKDRAVAIAQVTNGTTLLMAGGALFAAGLMTGSGPDDPNKRKALMDTGWKPFAMRLPDGSYMETNRLDPVMMPLHISALIAEVFANNGWNTDPSDDIFELVSMSALKFGQMMTDKTYMAGLANLFESFGKATNSRPLESWVNRTVAGATTPALLAGMRRADDPFKRQAFSIIDQMRNRVPVLSEGLPIAYDVFGHEVMYQEGFMAPFQLVNPFAVSKGKDEPIYAEIQRLKYIPEPMDWTITVPFAGNSVGVSLRDRPDIYSDMTRMMGGDDEYSLPNFRGVLNDFVTSDGYQDLSDINDPSIKGSKAEAISRVVEQGRRAARQVILDKYWADLQDMAKKEFSAQVELGRQKEAEATASSVTEAYQMLLEEAK